MATGMLPLCFRSGHQGLRARCSGSLRKPTVALLRLGVATDTGDAEGQPVDRRSAVPAYDARPLERAACRPSAAIARQVPPMYSALKRDGPAALRTGAARLEVERDARADPDLTAGCCSDVDGETLDIEVRLLEGHLRPGAGRGHCRRPGHARPPGGLRRLWVEPFRGPAHGLTLEEIERGRLRPAPVIHRALAAAGGPRLSLDVPRIDLDAGQSAAPVPGTGAASAPAGRASRSNGSRL